MLRFRERLARDVQASIDATDSVDENLTYFQTPPPNAIEYFLRPDLGNAPQLADHFGQYQLVRDYFELLCPICSTTEDLVCSMRNSAGELIVKPRAALEAQPLLVWSATHEDDVCPKCGNTRHSLMEDGLLRGYNQMHAVIGQRSGKSASVAFIGEYVEVRLINLQFSVKGGLQAYFGDLPSANYEITYLASNEVQGAETIYAKYRARRRHAPFFQRFVPWITQQQKRQTKGGFIPTPEGMQKWKYDELDAVLEHGYMLLQINAANSNSAGTRGRTRILGAIDELDYFKDTASVFSARESYGAMENSLMTARGRVRTRKLLPFLGSMLSITSPRSAEGYSMELLRNGANVKDMLTLHAATWDFTPYEPESHFESLKIKDPVRYRRDFAATPDIAASPLFHDRERFMKLAIGWGDEAIAKFGRFEFDDQLGQRYQCLRVDACEFKPAGYGPSYVIVFDAGKNFDAFALAIAHGVTNKLGQIVTVFDAVARVYARPGCEVWFSGMKNILGALRERIPILCARWDHWNSTQTVQDARVEYGIDAEQDAVTDLDKITLMTDAYQGLVRLLPPGEGEHPEAEGVDPRTMSDAAVLTYELLRLERDPKGKISNPRKGQVQGVNSDDLACVAAGAHKVIQRFGYTDKQTDHSAAARKKRSSEGLSRWSAYGGGSIGTGIDPLAVGLPVPPPRAQSAGGIVGSSHAAGAGGLASGLGAPSPFSGRGVGGGRGGRGW